VGRPSPNRPGRVAVVRALPGVGDLLCAVPALRALRQAAPRSEITLIGLDGAAWFPARYPHYIDDFLPVPAWPGLAEIEGPARAAGPFLAAARRRHFDVAIQMHGDGRSSNALTAALGAARWIGLGRREDEPPPGGLVGPYDTERHEVDRCNDVLALLGITVVDPTLEFPTTGDEDRDVARFVPPRSSLAVVHPGSSRSATRWSPLGFARVIEHLQHSVDHVVITGGPDERGLTEAVAAATAAAGVVDLGGATSLGVLGALMRRASVVVANDTGAAHLAAAVGAPLVTVCGPSDHVRWAPRGRLVQVVGGEPYGRWPTIRQVRRAVDAILAGAVRSGG
jgi:ADP-heptose:LPS heptosyltransferase